MTTIVTRAGKGSALTFTEADANFTNLNTAVVTALTAVGTTNTPAGGIAATNVQAAIDELDTEKAPKASPTFTGTITTPLTASRAVVTGASSELAVSAATATEVGYLSGVTSAIQTQINTRTGTSGATSNRNRLINGDFTLGQRGLTFTSATSPANSDDTYLLDRWTLLSDGNDIVDVTQATDVPTAPGARYSIGLDVETVNKKFGIIQFIERNNCQDLIGNTVTVSFKARVTSLTKLDNVKCAIISWSSTTDTVTSDVVSAWGVEGTNPTLVANCTYENTPANLGVTTSYATYSVSGLIDTASTANIAVFIWSDVTDTTLADFLYITDVQLEQGTVATPFERLSMNETVERCQRYYEKSYDLATAPGTATTVGAVGFIDSSTGGYWPITYKTKKRVLGGVAIFSPATGAGDKYRDESSAADFDAGSAYLGENGFRFGAAVGHGAGGEVLSFHWRADSEM